ncbi:MAG TPA: tripartite tricarboxylate transporter substrate binding protein [Pseudolabrys sp.]|nr:tripartite tricarboxylate transporter substrate binding protein [Pseudolabrys sp.]
MKFRIGIIGLLLTCVLAAPALAQSGNYPNRPIRVIVGFAAGGGNDIFARIVGQKLQDNIGQPVVVENKPGAQGRIAADYAAHQPPDGYTLLVGASGQMSMAAAIYPKLSYHPTKTFVPLAMIASFPLILVVQNATPAKSVQELVAYAKAHPDKANYASSSPAFTIATELLKLKTGMPGTAIPYKSSNESNVSVAGGNTLLTISDGPPAIPLIKGGQTRALAVTADKRSPMLPDVPSMAEIGLPDVDTKLWSGLFVQAGTPAPIVQKLETELHKVLTDKDVQEKLKKLAVDPGGDVSPADFTKLINKDIAVFTDVVKAANLKFEE